MTLKDLLHELEKAEGPRFKLNYGLFAMANSLPVPFTQEMTQAAADAIPLYTSSIDAAVALCGAVHPTLRIELRLYCEVSTAQLYTGLPGQYLNAYQHRTPALALCTAICRAAMEIENVKTD